MAIYDGVRVLDLTDEKGFLCGRLLGDLGADVIKIERPGGDPSRNVGPFYHDIPDPEKSLYWFSYNANKRGITLNIESSDGKEILKRLVKTSDVVIESFSPGYMDSIGLGYDVLNEVNSSIIMASITPFGQKGPYAHFKSSDIVCMAMSGLVFLTGDEDRPPVRIGFPQAYLIGGVAAAEGIAMAHYYRQTTGEGQYVDVSIREAIIPFLALAFQTWDIKKKILTRGGSRLSLTSAKAAKQQIIYPCKDGYIDFIIYGGSVGSKTNTGLAEWMRSEGIEPNYLKGRNSSNLDMATLTQEEFDQCEEFFNKLFQRFTKQQFLDEILKRVMMGYPLYTSSDILADPQLKARNFWVELEHPEINASITYPGEFIKMSETPCQLRCRAPHIGEHNEAIFCRELGFSKEDLVVLKQANVL